MLCDRSKGVFAVYSLQSQIAVRLQPRHENIAIDLFAS